MAQPILTYDFSRGKITTSMSECVALFLSFAYTSLKLLGIILRILKLPMNGMYTDSMYKGNNYHTWCFIAF